MKRKITHIRDLELIEKELSESQVGVFAVTTNREKVIQIATTFVYLYKNIYVFFNEENEIYKGVNLESSSSFIIFQDRVLNGKSYATSISISGLVKKVEDNRTMTEIKNNYLQKYAKPIDLFDKDASNLKALFIDSEEFIAIDQEE
jgi:nitroimidazol reductase NimA-like FMN-containing flavoprotein (pyridoxamine 5'-phosphate oxidase superfamily)